MTVYAAGLVAVNQYAQNVHGLQSRIGTRVGRGECSPISSSIIKTYRTNELRLVWTIFEHFFCSLTYQGRDLSQYDLSTVHRKIRQPRLSSAGGSHDCTPDVLHGRSGTRHPTTYVDHENLYVQSCGRNGTRTRLYGCGSKSTL